jgi:N-acetylglucosaminyldiphosphoundecaprenol N-acetyl-beta-D-mannosaminyltransferase
MSLQALPGRVQVSLLGAWVDPVAPKDAIQRILEWCSIGARQYVVTPNLDHCRLLRRNAKLAAAYNQSGMVIPDGWPLIAASRVTSYPLRRRVAGADLVIPLCKGAALSGFSVFLLGSTTEVLRIAAEKLRAEAPGLTVAGLHAPPLGFEADDREVKKINQLICEARPHIVLVALGAPKQELWMASNVPNLPIGAALGVGAALDFLAGRQRRAPRVFQALGLEWLWRALSDPHRLGKRYLACIVSLPALFLPHLRRHLLTKHNAIRRVNVPHLPETI